MTGVCYGTYADPSSADYTDHDSVASADTTAMASTSAEWSYT